MKFLRGVFYAEVILNLVTALYSFLAPVQYVSLFTNHSGGIVSELLRWYGVLLFVFTYVELRALLSKRDEIITVIIEGFLVGDVMELVAAVLFANASAGWNQNLIGTVGLTLLLALCRIGWLWLYYHKRRSTTNA